VLLAPMAGISGARLAADLVHAAQPAGAVLQAMVVACAARLEAAVGLTPSSHL
jgi:hypothetical protein